MVDAGATAVAQVVEFWTMVVEVEGSNTTESLFLLSLRSAR